MAAATAAATAQQQMQTLDPALTMADTQALLGTDFPAMRDFAHVVGSTDPLPSYGGHQQQGHQQQHVSAMQNDPYCGDSTQHRLPMPSLQPDAPPLAVPQMRAACKAEPTSPAGGGGGWVPVSGWGSDGGGAYNSFMGASPFGDCSGEYADMAAHFGMDAGSWNSADEEGGFTQADLFPPAVQAIPAIRMVPADIKIEPAGFAAQELRVPSLRHPSSEASDDTDVPQGSISPAGGMALSGSGSVSGNDASAATGGAVPFEGIRTRCHVSGSLSGALSGGSPSAGAPVILSASQQCAALLMPAIGGQPSGRRPPRLGAKPSDAELKETIAALQRTTSRVPGSVDEVAYTATRADCLQRYREKKLRRLDVNTIRYMKRKINADRRPRIKGRFVKAEELDAYRAGLLPGQDGRPPSA